MKPSLERDLSTDCGAHLYYSVLNFEEELDQAGNFLQQIFHRRQHRGCDVYLDPDTLSWLASAAHLQCPQTVCCSMLSRRFDAKPLGMFNMPAATIDWEAMLFLALPSPLNMYKSVITLSSAPPTLSPLLSLGVQKTDDCRHSAW
jgi:hypothetical protein